MWPLTFSCEFEIINLKKKKLDQKKMQAKWSGGGDADVCYSHSHHYLNIWM